MNAPDLIEPLIGFRGFELEDDTWLASAGYGPGIWRPGENIAKCHGGYERKWQEHSQMASMAFGHHKLPVLPSPHTKAPEEHCDCGFYAMHSVAGLGRILERADIIAAVAASGKVCLHQTGWRAEKAEVILVASNGDVPPSRVEYIARTYRARPVALGELEEAAKEYGAIAPASLMPKDSEPKASPHSQHFHVGSGAAVFAGSGVRTTVKEADPLRWVKRLMWTATALNLGAFGFHMTNLL